MITYSRPGTVVRALDEHKLLWRSLNVAGSQVVLKRPIKAPLLVERRLLGTT